MAKIPQQTAIKKIKERQEETKRLQTKKSNTLSFIIAFIIASVIAAVSVVYLNTTGIYKVEIPQDNNATSFAITATQNDELESHDVVIATPLDYSLELDDLEENISQTQIVPTMSKEEIEAKEAEVERIIKAQELAHSKADIQIPNLQKSTPKPTPPVAINHKPKLMIIVDDVSNENQLRAIKSLPFRVTPSIFPPTDMAPQSNKLAQGLSHYMVHLPMESSKAKFNAMRATLMADDSDEKIVSRVDQIRELFPTDKYINNHTGSVFTSNYDAMQRLYLHLKERGFVFIDSKTSSSSKVEQITKELGDRYISRDVFLDNSLEKSQILIQLKLAIRKAHQNGHAIAICHPHPETIRALKSATKLLSSVQTLYIDEFYK